MLFKIEFHLKWNVTQNGMSLEWNVTQNGMSLKMECYSKWNVIQNGMSLKMECHSKFSLKHLLILYKTDRGIKHWFFS